MRVCGTGDGIPRARSVCVIDVVTVNAVVPVIENEPHTAWKLRRKLIDASGASTVPVYPMMTSFDPHDSMNGPPLGLGPCWEVEVGMGEMVIPVGCGPEGLAPPPAPVSEVTSA